MKKLKVKRELGRVLEGLVCMYELPYESLEILNEIVETFKTRGIEESAAQREASMACKIATRHCRDMAPVQLLNLLKENYAIGLERAGSNINRFLERQNKSLEYKRTFGEMIERKIFLEDGKEAALTHGPALNGRLAYAIIGSRYLGFYRGAWSRERLPLGRTNNYGNKPRKNLGN